VEQGRAYKRLMEANGWTAQDLADTLGVEPTAVYRALNLLKLPEDVAARVDAGEIRATAAYEISKLQFAEDQREVAEQVVKKGLDHKATVATVSARREAHSKRRGKPKERQPAEQRHRGSRGVKVTIVATVRHTAEDLVADLREIADRLERKAEAAA
jgi:ParB family chromosome partitioning protein